MAKQWQNSRFSMEFADSRPRVNLVRCDWARTDLSIDYHDREWGVPQHDDRALFELLILEETILKKRENYRIAFDGFDATKIARYDRRKIRTLLRDEGIVRNRLKVAAAVQNAAAFLRVQSEHGSFDRYIWRFVGGKPRMNSWRTMRQIPARTVQSDAMSEDLKARGFSFVGSTICYAFMQAAGLVNDHMVHCFRYRQVARSSSR